jgi:hypothetical protein
MSYMDAREGKLFNIAHLRFLLESAPRTFHLQAVTRKALLARSLPAVALSVAESDLLEVIAGDAVYEE